MWSVNDSCSRFGAILPAQVSLPSWVEVVFCCTIKSDHLDRWIEDHVDFVPYKFGAPDSILGPDLGQFWSSFGFHFGARSGVLEFVCNSRGPERCPKMESSSCLRWNSVTLVALTLPILGWSVSRLKTVDPPKRNGLGKKKGAQKWNPKQGPKFNLKIRPQNGIWRPKFVQRRKQSLHDLLSAVC